MLKPQSSERCRFDFRRCMPLYSTIPGAHLRLHPHSTKASFHHRLKHRSHTQRFSNPLAFGTMRGKESSKPRSWSSGRRAFAPFRWSGFLKAASLGRFHALCNPSFDVRPAWFTHLAERKTQPTPPFSPKQKSRTDKVWVLWMAANRTTPFSSGSRASPTPRLQGKRLTQPHHH